ncbi:Dynamitin-domain-containing protein [Umbelopsis sp. AD052]|nr:Dynamitin-domain-containing protein [Umbelopsis sp. AD052]
MSSKYSTLPDIDDQPDVFETEDNEGNDHIRSFESQEAQYSDDENEDVDKQGVPLKDAASRFQGAVVDASDTDFSDRLTRRRKAMYRTFIKRSTLETSEYELLPKDPTLHETSLQKLRRLQYELQELSDEVEKKKEDEVTSTEVRQGDLLSQISYLQSDLSRISSSLTGRGEDEQDGLTAQAAEARQLIKQLEVYKNIVAADDHVPNEPEKAASPAANGETLTYELFYNPKTAQHLKQAQIVEIDSRIAKLEHLIGYSSGDNVDSLPNNLSSTSIVALVSKLEKQMTVLSQPRHLDMISRRVKLVNSELDKLNELKHGKGEAGNNSNYGNNQKNGEVNAVSDATDDRINTLFDLMKKVEPMLNITPAVLTRLKALQGLHTESATFSESIKMISEEQAKITDELENLGGVSNKLQKSFQENDANIQANMQIMDDRMTDLLRRINNLNTSS